MNEIQGKLTLVQVSARFELVRIQVYQESTALLLSPYLFSACTGRCMGCAYAGSWCKWHTVSLPYTLGSLTEDWRYCTRVWTSFQLMLCNFTPPYPTEYKPVHNKVWLLPLFLTPYPREFKWPSIPFLSQGWPSYIQPSFMVGFQAIHSF